MRGEAGTFSVYLPTEGLDSARVLITAESEIEDIVVIADDIGQVSVQTGQRFAVVEIANPTSQTFNIAFAATGNSSADLIMEWDLQLMSRAESGDMNRFWLADSGGRNAFLNPFFERRVFPISTGAIELHLEGGYLYWDADEEEVFRLLQAHLGVFGINMPDLAQGLVNVPTPPVDDQTPPDDGQPAPTPTAIPPDDQPAGERATEPGSLLRTLANIGLGIVLVLAVALVVVLLVSRNKKPARPRVAGGASELVFAGKLDLYVIIGTIADYKGDTKPRTFKFPQSQRVSAQAILKKCKLSNTFPGSGQIYFKINEQGGLQIINGSDCAIYVGSELLVKNQPYVLRHKGNVRIRDTYDISELVISPRFLYQA